MEPSRYKGAYGGRGSGKSHCFAEMAIEDALRWPGDAGEGLRLLSFREVQKSLKESAKFLLESKLNKFGLGEAQGFKVFSSEIRTPGDGVIVFSGMQDHTADSVKSYEGFHRAWGEETQTISSHSLSLLRPTIRWEDTQRGLESQLWFGWNPRRKTDPVDRMFRLNPGPNMISVKANYSDNPWFPRVLEEERLDCLKNNPEEYSHIWEGDYAGVYSGSYYASSLLAARSENRVGDVRADPNMIYRIYVDIGGTGARADAFTMWVCQFIGQKITVLDYYEAVGQPASTHLSWLRNSGYSEDKTKVWLPHDGKKQDAVYDASYEKVFIEAGYPVEVVPNQGKGAAKSRIEAARKLFNRMWFDKKCEPGLEALAWYHEKKDEVRGIGLGPNHDWSSHGADSFGMMAVCYEEPLNRIKPAKNYPKLSIA